MPILTVPIGMAGIPLSFLPMLALGGKLIWRIRQAESETARRTGDDDAAHCQPVALAPALSGP
jgi:hypothetical protein